MSVSGVTFRPTSIRETCPSPFSPRWSLYAARPAPPAASDSLMCRTFSDGTRLILGTPVHAAAAQLSQRDPALRPGRRLRRELRRAVEPLPARPARLRHRQAHLARP